MWEVKFLNCFSPYFRLRTEVIRGDQVELASVSQASKDMFFGVWRSKSSHLLFLRCWTQQLTLVIRRRTSLFSSCVFLSRSLFRHEQSFLCCTLRERQRPWKTILNNSFIVSSWQFTPLVVTSFDDSMLTILVTRTTIYYLSPPFATRWKTKLNVNVLFYQVCLGEQEKAARRKSNKRFQDF